MIYDAIAINVDFPEPRGYIHMGLKKSDLGQLRSQPNLKIIVVNSFHRRPSDNQYSRRIAKLESSFRNWRDNNGR